MANLYLFNKPFQVLSQFTDNSGKATLADFIEIKKIYPAGRLDFDSEGLLLLTDDGALQHYISDPRFKLPKKYWVQVDGDITDTAIQSLQNGVSLKDGLTRPAEAKVIPQPVIGPRSPPIRQRKNGTESWIELTISEGKNRQIRRMTAHVGFPTLRLIRHSIGSWTTTNLAEGQWEKQIVTLPEPKLERNKTDQNKTRKKKKPSPPRNPNTKSFARSKTRRK